MTELPYLYCVCCEGFACSRRRGLDVRVRHNVSRALARQARRRAGRTAALG